MRYAVLHHTGIDEPHYDFLVEISHGSDLAAWRLPEWPVDGETEAIRLKDHRRLYLSYEGSLSGDRGTIRRVADGECGVSEVAVDSLTVQIQSGGGSKTIRLEKRSGNAWRVSTVRRKNEPRMDTDEHR
jgi:hypothetical protein